ncbi:titin [Cynara cardunculus var. scolymus]|uniref:titin n=1 Tax=Cynara cardunculus var. scolymus TaxID=59895 RepID=UPI000D6240EB|nr:titin [Cynara cardunculus var. scolymus]
MACYDDGYMWPQDQHLTYDLLHHPDSVSFSGYDEVDTYDTYTVSEFYEPKFIEHYHHPQDYDYGHNSYSSAGPEINYFAYNYVEPKLIAYEPVACDTGYVSYHTNYSISYPQPMDSGFNEPEFEEYDPTPYGGGYDIVSVYGKPLPPSDKTCYPRSNPNPIEPTPKSNPEFKPEPTSKPEPGSKPIFIPTPIPLVDPKPEPVPIPVPLVEPEPEPEPAPAPVPVPMPEPLESKEVGATEREEHSYPDYGYDYPWPEYDHGYGIGVGYDHGYGKQVVQIPPYEYNPEVVDLCENIFGSWPCLTRIRKQQMGVDNNPGITYPEKGHRNPWEDCANYFFRGPVRASYDQ